jgi:predicted transcriptional regulator
MPLNNFSFTFNPNQKGLRKILGDLETDIMEVMWATRKATVRQVHQRLKTRREIAYTTVMTVMGRLADKGLLAKRRDGNAFVYRATVSLEMFTQSTIKRIINELLSDFATPAISQFIDAVDSEQPEKIEELARLLEAKRNEKDV